jgi:hypothetical protein
MSDNRQSPQGSLRTRMRTWSETIWSEIGYGLDELKFYLGCLGPPIFILMLLTYIAWVLVDGSGNPFAWENLQVFLWLLLVIFVIIPACLGVLAGIIQAIRYGKRVVIWLWRKVVKRNRLVLPANVREPDLVRQVDYSQWRVVHRRVRLRSAGKGILTLLGSPIIVLTAYAFKGEVFNVVTPIVTAVSVIWSGVSNLFRPPLLICGRVAEKTDGADEALVSLGFPRTCLVLDAQTAYLLTRRGVESYQPIAKPWTVVATPRLYEAIQEEESVAVICILSLSPDALLAVYRLYEFVGDEDLRNSTVGQDPEAFVTGSE